MGQNEESGIYKEKVLSQFIFLCWGVTLKKLILDGSAASLQDDGTVPLLGSETEVSLIIIWWKSLLIDLLFWHYPMKKTAKLRGLKVVMCYERILVWCLESQTAPFFLLLNWMCCVQWTKVGDSCVLSLSFLSPSPPLSSHQHLRHHMCLSMYIILSSALYMWLHSSYSHT